MRALLASLAPSAHLMRALLASLAPKALAQGVVKHKRNPQDAFSRISRAESLAREIWRMRSAREKRFSASLAPSAHEKRRISSLAREKRRVSLDILLV